MAHKLVTDEMVEKATRAALIRRGEIADDEGGSPLMKLSEINRAALEAVADDLIEACAKEVEAMGDRTTHWESGPWAVDYADHLRSLKSQGQ
jgi:transcription initiation factor IIE alpha subunit